MSHTILMLAMYPKYQEKVVQELQSGCSLEDSTITLDTISQLSYMDMVIKEVMRLFPIGPILARNCLEDTAISNCTIPKGTFIILSIHNLHRNPQFWGANPNDFDPDNFLPERVAVRHPYAYLPFSGGTRNCIVSVQILVYSIRLSICDVKSSNS